MSHGMDRNGLCVCGNIHPRMKDGALDKKGEVKTEVAWVAGMIVPLTRVRIGDTVELLPDAVGL